ncbi:hypothetical protein B9Z55_027048 [Caenorhabditis nigoni]|uniref:Uncharacterized protein n=2 Tax=Caenorhabditis nigoni TaxID=1611254 RepID=A0A2G5SIE9_9PELO|nr:hypothetical protein B9Z55_027048 [Caenorhabditis nigoni]
MSKMEDVGNSGDVEWTEEKRMKLYETVAALLEMREELKNKGNSKSPQDELLEKILDLLGSPNLPEDQNSEISNFKKELSTIMPCFDTLTVLLKVFKTMESKILARKLVEYKENYENQHFPTLESQKNIKIKKGLKKKCPEMFALTPKRLEEMKKMEEWKKDADDLVNSEFLEAVVVVDDVMGVEIQNTLDVMFGFRNDGGNLEILKAQMLLKTDEFFAEAEGKIRWMGNNRRQINSCLKKADSIEELPGLFRKFIDSSKLSRDGLMIWFQMVQESKKVHKSEVTSPGEILKVPELQNPENQDSASSEDIQEVENSKNQGSTSSEQLPKIPGSENPENQGRKPSEGIPKIQGSGIPKIQDPTPSEQLLKVPETENSKIQDPTSSEEAHKIPGPENTEIQDATASEEAQKMTGPENLEIRDSTPSEQLLKVPETENPEIPPPTSSEELLKIPEDSEIQKLEQEAAKKKKKYQKRKQAKKAKQQNPIPPEKLEILKKAGYLKKSENWRKKSKHQKTSENREDDYENSENPKSNLLERIVNYLNDVIDRTSVNIAEDVVELDSDDDVKDSESQEPKITDSDVSKMNDEFQKKVDDVRDINELSVIMKSSAFLIWKFWNQENQELTKKCEIQQPKARFWLPKLSEKMKFAGKNASEHLKLLESNMKAANSKIDSFLEKHSKNQLIFEYSVFKKPISLNYATTEFENALNGLFGKNSKDLDLEDKQKFLEILDSQTSALVSKCLKMLGFEEVKRYWFSRKHGETMEEILSCFQEMEIVEVSQELIDLLIILADQVDDLLLMYAERGMLRLIEGEIDRVSNFFENPESKSFDPKNLKNQESKKSKIENSGIRKIKPSETPKPESEVSNSDSGSQKTEKSESKNLEFGNSESETCEAKNPGSKISGVKNSDPKTPESENSGKSEPEKNLDILLASRNKFRNGTENGTENAPKHKKYANLSKMRQDTKNAPRHRKCAKTPHLRQCTINASRHRICAKARKLRPQLKKWVKEYLIHISTIRQETDALIVKCRESLGLSESDVKLWLGKSEILELKKRKNSELSSRDRLRIRRFNEMEPVLSQIEEPMRHFYVVIEKREQLLELVEKRKDMENGTKTIASMLEHLEKLESSNSKNSESEDSESEKLELVSSLTATAKLILQFYFQETGNLAALAKSDHSKISKLLPLISKNRKAEKSQREALLDEMESQIPGLLSELETSTKLYENEQKNLGNVLKKTETSNLKNGFSENIVPLKLRTALETLFSTNFDGDSEILTSTIRQETDLLITTCRKSFGLTELDPIIWSNKSEILELKKRNSSEISLFEQCIIRRFDALEPVGREADVFFTLIKVIIQNRDQLLGLVDKRNDMENISKSTDRFFELLESSDDEESDEDDDADAEIQNIEEEVEVEIAVEKNSGDSEDVENSKFGNMDRESLEIPEVIKKAENLDDLHRKAVPQNPDSTDYVGYYGPGEFDEFMKKRQFQGKNQYEWIQFVLSLIGAITVLSIPIYLIFSI